MLMKTRLNNVALPTIVYSCQQQYRSVLFSIIQYCSVLFSIVQYSSILLTTPNHMGSGFFCRFYSISSYGAKLTFDLQCFSGRRVIFKGGLYEPIFVWVFLFKLVVVLLDLM